MAVAQRSIRRAHLADQRRLEQHAVVGNRTVGGRELHRRHGQLVPDGEARRAGARPLARRTQPPRGLGGKLDAGRRAEPERPQHAILLIGVQPRRELREGDVARHADRVRQRERRKGVLVGQRCRPPGHAVDPTFARHVVVGAHAIVHDERGRREDLGERSRLERLGERARPHAAVRAPRRDGQHLAGRGIEHHDIAAVRLHVVDRIVERPLRDLLQLGVEREHHVVARDRLGDHARGRFVLAACAVLENDGGSGCAGEEAVEQPLEASATASAASTIVAHASDHGAREVLRGIEAAHHRLEVDAADGTNGLYLERGVRSREPGITTVLRPDHVARWNAQLARDRGEVVRGITQLVGRDPHVIRLLRERDRGAVPVIQRAAARVEHDALRALRGRAGGIAPSFQQLHLSRAHDQREQAEPETDFHHAQPNEWFGH